MDKIEEFGDKAYDFVMTNFDNPIFWLIILIIMLVIMFFTIGDLANK